MSKADLVRIAGMNKVWATERAQAALTLIDRHTKGEMDLGLFRENMLNLISGPGHETLERDADDSELKTWLMTSVENAARSGGQ